MADPKSFAFAWTLNNFTPEEEALIQSVPCRYVIYGREHIENGTPHLQGYIQFDQQKRFEQVKRLLGGRAHIERAKGKPQENIAYCSKEDKAPFTKGEPDHRRGQGKRNDLADACELIRDTRSLKEVALQFPTTFVKYHKGFKELINITTPDRDWKPEVIFAWGEPGVGKTRSIRQKEGDKLYIKTDEKKDWFDNYDPNVHEAILLDEFTGQTPAEKLNRILDYAPYQVECKGGYIKLLVKRFYICSNYCFDEACNMGGYTEMQKKTVKRRINEFVHVSLFPGTEWNDWLKPADDKSVHESQMDDPSPYPPTPKGRDYSMPRYETMDLTAEDTVFE